MITPKKGDRLPGLDEILEENNAIFRFLKEINNLIHILIENGFVIFFVRDNCCVFDLYLVDSQPRIHLPPKKGKNNG